jgi:hypothetical protein
MISLWNSAHPIAELRGRYQVYREAAVWVCANTAEEAGIAVPEIGIIGWICNHRIIDPYGLVTPEMLPFIQGEYRPAGLAALRPEAIIIQNFPPDTPSILPDVAFFEDAYRPLTVIREPYFPRPAAIFLRQP